MFFGTQLVLQDLPEGLSSRSRSDYSKSFKLWRIFCDQFRISLTAPSQPNLLRFAAWQFRRSTNSGSRISSHITGILSTLKTHAISVDRRAFTALTQLLKGYNKRRPPRHVQVDQLPDLSSKVGLLTTTVHPLTIK